MRRVLVTVLLLAACSSGTSAPKTQTVTVFAAASLTKAFTAEAKAFEKDNPGTHIALSFAGSQTLVAQVQQGAPADVLVTADVSTMQSVESKITQPHEVFAHNSLAILTAPGNPKGLRTLADLARPGLRLVLAGPTVPAGKAAVAALARAHVTVHPVSLEDAVTGVVEKVRLGEADAGIGYVTDIGPGVAGTPVPGTRTDLAIGELTSAGDAFYGFVTNDEGLAILRRFGFT